MSAAGSVKGDPAEGAHIAQDLFAGKSSEEIIEGLREQLDSMPKDLDRPITLAVPVEQRWAMRYHQARRQLQRERLGSALFFALLGVAFLLMGCSPDRPPSELATSCEPGRAEWILACIEAANPHSDEEPEDSTAQCERTSIPLFCGPGCYQESTWHTIRCKTAPTGAGGER